MKLLRKNLLIFSGARNSEAAFVQDPNTLELHKFDRREQFLLEALRDPYQEKVLVALFNAKFNADYRIEDLDAFIAKLDAWGLLQQEQDTDQAVQSTNRVSSPPATSTAERRRMPPLPSDEQTQDLGDDHPNPAAAPPRRGNYQHLFQPERLLNGLRDFLGFTRHLLWLIPLAFVLAVVGFSANWPLVKTDLALLSSKTTLFTHILFSLFTTGITTQLARGAVARYFDLRTPSFGLIFVLGLVPRFKVQIEGLRQADRHTRLWLAATPVLLRFVLFSGGVTMWLIFRTQGTVLSLFGLALSFVSMVSFLFIANPLMGGSGYQWLSTYFNNPRLRDKAFRALRFQLRKPPGVVAEYAEDSWRLRLYALASVVFALALIGFITLSLSTWLELHYSGLGVTVALLLVAYMVVRFRQRLGAANGLASKARGHTGTQRWGTGAAAASESPPHTDPEIAGSSGRRSGRWHRGGPRLLLLVLLALAMFVPYRYEAGGPALVFPLKAQQIYAQYSGVVERVFFHGGETVAGGTVIAEMTNINQRHDIEITQAQIEKKQQQIEALLSTPSPEQLALAEAAVQTAEVRLKYSKQQVDRLRKVYEKQAISYESYEEALKQQDLAKQQVVESKANLEAIKSQVNPHEVEVLKADLARLKTDLAYFTEVLQRTKLKMPFDGVITTMDLDNLTSKYLEQGDLFAEAEDISRVKVEIDVPESEMDVVAVGDRVRLKLLLFPGRVLRGNVVDIYPTSKQAAFGTVVTVVTYIDNPNGRLKPGMTGRAKIEGEQMYLIEAFTRALQRFVLIEAWSWLP